MPHFINFQSRITWTKSHSRKKHLFTLLSGWRFWYCKQRASDKRVRTARRIVCFWTGESGRPGNTSAAQRWKLALKADYPITGGRTARFFLLLHYNTGCGAYKLIVCLSAYFICTHSFFPLYHERERKRKSALFEFRGTRARIRLYSLAFFPSRSKSNPRANNTFRQRWPEIKETAANSWACKKLFRLKISPNSNFSRR